MVAAYIQTSGAEILRQELDKCSMRSVAGVFGAQFGHPHLPIPDFFFRWKQAGLIPFCCGVGWN
jgi:hypothetical protein